MVISFGICIVTYNILYCTVILLAKWSTILIFAWTILLVSNLLRFTWVFECNFLIYSPPILTFRCNKNFLCYIKSFICHTTKKQRIFHQVRKICYKIFVVIMCVFFFIIFNFICKICTFLNVRMHNPRSDIITLAKTSNN